jgi:cell division septum initiation protein DivIVA
MSEAHSNGRVELSEDISPDDIERATFSNSSDGYDKLEVQVFLRTAAEAMRDMMRQRTTAVLAQDRPYDAVGREIGTLMQHAYEAADQVKAKAEADAAAVLRDAHKVSRHADDEARSIKHRAESEISLLREEARAAADRLNQQAEQELRIARAEASILQQEARRSAKRLRDEAKRRADQIDSAARSEATQRSHEIERRVRRLQEVEVKLRRRVEYLSVRLQALKEQAQHAEVSQTEGDDEASFSPPSVKIIADDV